MTSIAPPRMATQAVASPEGPAAGRAPALLLGGAVPVRRRHARIAEDISFAVCPARLFSARSGARLRGFVILPVWAPVMSFCPSLYAGRPEMQNLRRGFRERAGRREPGHPALVKGGGQLC